jgi:DNA-binding transcriptional LysR family regulator
MDPRKLKYFLAVAEERHLGRAAERLHMSQPPLTRQIQLLEEEVGVALFKRTPRGMLLTQAGETLLADANSIQMLLHQAAERTRRAGQGLQGQLDIGVYGSAMFDGIPRLLAHYHAEHPEVKIVIHPGQTPAQVMALRQGRVLAAFERMRPREDDIAEMLVLKEALYVALHADDPLAKQSVVDIQQLRDRPMLMPEASALNLVNVGLELCRANGFEPITQYGTNDLVASTMMVASGLGICLVPECITRLNMPGLAVRPLTCKKPKHMTLYCFHMKEESSPLLASFLESVKRFGKLQSQITRAL